MTTVRSDDRVMPTPDLGGVNADVVDMPHSVCDCERQTGTVVRIHWLTGEYHATTGRDALENGPEYVLDRDTVRSRPEHRDWFLCCAWCYPEVLDNGIEGAIDDPAGQTSLRVQVSRAWVAMSGAQVAA